MFKQGRDNRSRDSESRLYFGFANFEDFATVNFDAFAISTFEVSSDRIQILKMLLSVDMPVLAARFNVTIIIQINKSAVKFTLRRNVKLFMFQMLIHVLRST